MTKTAAEVREELDRMTRKGGKTDWWKMNEGTKYVRIGPPWEKGGEFWKEVPFHGTFKEKVYCRSIETNPETGKPKSCPVCKRVAELKGDRSNRGKKLWSLIRQKSESLWNVLVAKVKRREDGSLRVRRYEDGHFKVWRLSMQWHKMMIELFANEDYRRKSILGITHPKYGRLVRVKRVGSGRDDTEYSFHPVPDISPIMPTKEERLEILKSLVNLDKLVYASSKEELEAFVVKMEKRARKLAAIEAEESGEEEVDDEEEDVEEDEEEKPRKKSKHHDEDDDEESDESDEEDEEDDDLERSYKKVKKQLKRKERDEDDE
jgi:hypothetical protein